MTFLTWLDHLEESFTKKKVQFEMIYPPVKNSCPPFEDIFLNVFTNYSNKVLCYYYIHTTIYKTYLHQVLFTYNYRKTKLLFNPDNTILATN